MGGHYDKKLWNNPFDNSIWNTISHLGQRFFFPRGTIVQHNRLHGIFWIKKGRVCLSYFSDEGKEIKALYYNKNAIFNEARTFSSSNPDCTFICVEDCELYFFPREFFCEENFISSFPHIVQNLLSTMAEKILIHYYTLTSLRVDSDVVNVSKFILQLYREHGNKLTFNIVYNQQDIADILGVHRTTVARAIRKLKEEGILTKIARYEVIIKDIEMLKKISRDELPDQDESFSREEK